MIENEKLTKAKMLGLLTDLNNSFDKEGLIKAINLFNRMSIGFWEYFELDLDESKDEIKENLVGVFKEDLGSVLEELDLLNDSPNQNNILDSNKRAYIFSYLEDVQSELDLDLVDIDVELIANLLQSVLNFDKLGAKGTDDKYKERWALIEPYFDERYNLVIDTITKKQITKAGLMRKIGLTPKQLESTIKWAEREKLKEDSVCLKD